MRLQEQMSILQHCVIAVFYFDRNNSYLILVIGPNKQQQGTVSIKNMIKGETTVIKQIEAAKFLKS
jgi:histidyl-tRNA synthetase